MNEAKYEKEKKNVDCKVRIQREVHRSSGGPRPVQRLRPLRGRVRAEVEVDHATSTLVLRPQVQSRRAQMQPRVLRQEPPGNNYF